jgi:hypothetical protein
MRPAVDILAVILTIGVLAALMVKHAVFFHDDAYITLRYAQSFAETGLIQWNRGEWTEGYTSLLHVVLTGGLISLGLPAVTAAQGVNAIAAVSLLTLTGVTAFLIAPRADLWAIRILTVLTVAVAPSLAIWTMGGLEAVVVAALVMGGLSALLVHLERRRRWHLVLAALTFSLAVLTRLDASVFIAGAGLGVLLSGTRSRVERLWISAIVVGVPAAVAFTQMGIRLGIYGEVFPLTFYAKTELPLSVRLSDGLPYILASYDVLPVFGFAALAVLAALATRQLQGHAVIILFAVLLPLLYIVWTGGDHMPAGRMLVPLIAPVSLLLLALSLRLPPAWRSALIGIPCLVTLLSSLSKPALLTDPAAFVGELVGRHIDAAWPSDITIALNTAGSTPFYAGADRVFIDMLGLNDPVIAKREDVPLLAPGQGLPGHFKGDGAYVLSRQPDRIILGPAEGADVSDPWFLSDVELGQSPEFAECYVQVIETIPYGQEVAERGPRRPNPLVFTYYDRVCG